MGNISVVITTYGRVPLVGALLKSLEDARNRFPGKLEVIIVDDSSRDDAIQLAILCEKYHARMETRGPRVTSKRNHGAALAEHEIILFLDSDCLATPDLLQEHAACYQDPGVGAVLGLLRFTGPDTWFWHAIQATPFVMPFGFARMMDEVPWGPTANFSVQKTVFDEIQGFDETFPQKPGGEDVDLGLRIVKAGYRIRGNPQALVYHTKETWMPVKAMCQRLFHWGIAECYLMERHPERLVQALPRKSLVYAAVFGFMLIASLLSQRWVLAAVFPLWLLLDLLLHSLLQLLWEGRSLKALRAQFASVILVLVNELGMATEAVRRRAFRYLFLQMLYTPGQMSGEWHYGGSRMWSSLISIWALLMLLAS